MVVMHSFIDMHMHSTASDGKYSPAILLEKIAELGIKTFALTDHDTVAGVKDMENLVSSRGDDTMRFIRGIEFSCKTKIGKCHILGYGYDWHNESFISILTKGAVLRSQKLEQRLDFLKHEYDIVFDEEGIAMMRGMNSVGKPHIGELMVRMGVASSVGEAIKNYIDNCPTLNNRLPADEVIHAIRAAGGISVWAHPLGGVGEIHMSADKFLEQLACLMDTGLQGLECYYSRYDCQEVDYLVSCAKEHGLLISGGSDYHGRKKYPDLGTLNADTIPIEEKQLTILQVLYGDSVL